jgi:ABC-2 type transport system ATP-binding protein
MTDHALTLCAVSTRRLSSVSLALVPGEIAGVVGAQGAGKTTLLQVAAGSLTPRTGDARVWGVRSTSPGARRLVGYAPEHPAFPPAVTVRELLEYYARLHVRPHRRRQVVREALDVSGLSAVGQLPASTLAKADLQRLSLAQAALGGRRVLVLDELLCGLDAFARRDLVARIAHFAAQGVAVLITARDPLVLERLVARIVVLENGRIVRAGSLASLLGERVLEVILDAPPREPPPGFRVTASGLEAPLAGRTAESALALCRAHRLAVRASRVRVKSLEEVVLETRDGH